MRLAHFFIEHPRFATVLSAFVTLLGLGALAILPVAQYPEIVPPCVATLLLGAACCSPSTITRSLGESPDWITLKPPRISPTSTCFGATVPSVETVITMCCD